MAKTKEHSSTIADLEPDRFTQLMRNHWENSLGLAASPALLAAWRGMAETLNQYAVQKPKKWAVLELPTGSGKTQGLTVYCAALTSEVLKTGNLDSHPGILIITRFTDEAEKIAKEINNKAGEQVAIAIYKGNMATADSIRKVPVLIATHSSYASALSSSSDEESYSFRKLTNWAFGTGTRRLTVIDEALDAVSTYMLDYDKLRMIRGIIPHHIEQAHSATCKQLDALIEKLQTLIITQAGKSLELRAGELLKINKVDITTLQTALKHDNTILKILGEKNIIGEIDAFFKTLSYIQDTWSIYTKEGHYHHVNTAEVELPPYLNSAVILDATASCNEIYALLHKGIDRPTSTLTGIRSYQNVALHVYFGDSVAKSHLKKQSDKELTSELSKAIPLLSADTPFLLITPKIIREKISEKISTLYPHIQLGHWGNIDGRNEWQDLDTIVLYGLPYIGNTISATNIRAYNEWLNNAHPEYNPNVSHGFDEGGGYEISIHEEYSDTSAYENGHISNSIIQAINRICCRKVIDAHGNCPPADIHLFLKADGKDTENQTILDNIKRLMPNIRATEYRTSKADKAIKFTKGELAIIGYLKSQPVGDYEIATIAAAANVSASTLDRLIKRYLNPESGMAVAMRQQAGVTEYVTAKGKYAVRKFIKTTIPPA